MTSSVQRTSLAEGCANASEFDKSFENLCQGFDESFEKLCQGFDESFEKLCQGVADELFADSPKEKVH